MRKLITWIVVTIGVTALVRKLRRRGENGATEAAQPADDDPADELRQKLASSRETNGGAQASMPDAEAVDPPVPAPAAQPTIDERRADVHEEGRAAIDEMRQSAED
jgi:hypothetical protein